MKIHKDANGITREHEHWYEYFMLSMGDIRMDVGLAEMAPKFFLPVSQDRLSGRIVCWIFPLAPFAMLFSLLGHAFKSIWFDLVEVNLLLQEWILQRRK